MRAAAGAAHQLESYSGSAVMGSLFPAEYSRFAENTPDMSERFAGRAARMLRSDPPGLLETIV